MLTSFKIKLANPAWSAVYWPELHRRELVLLLLALGVAAGFKVFLSISGSAPFNADEAVVALMARHILQGERPIFFYGQSYMGSLDAFLVAAGFALFGQQVWVIRLVQGVLYLGTLLTTAWLGKEVFRSWKVGITAAWLLAIPVVNLSLYTTASLGGYGEALLYGNAILLLAIKIAGLMEKDGTPPHSLWLLWGFLSGAGLWIFGLTLVYSLPAGLYLLFSIYSWLASRSGLSTFRRLKAFLVPILLIAAGVLLGALPWLLYGFEQGFGRLVGELGGEAIAGKEAINPLVKAGGRLFSFLVLGMTVLIGLRPPWAIHWLAVPLLPFALVFWMAVLGYMIWKFRFGSDLSRPALLAGVIGALLCGFLFTPFGGDPSGRYFLPIAIPLALFAASGLRSLSIKFGKIAWIFPAILLAFQLWGNLEAIQLSPARLTTQFYPVTQIDHRRDEELIEFLRLHGVTRGYTNYWVAYPLAFLSHEELIFTPRLPYHTDFRYTERDDRFPLYREAVEVAPDLAYITTHHPALDARLQEEFDRLGIAWEEAQIGDYQIFYRLSRKVEVEELHLGKAYP